MNAAQAVDCCRKTLAVDQSETADLEGHQESEGAAHQDLGWAIAADEDGGSAAAGAVAVEKQRPRKEMFRGQGWTSSKPGVGC